MVVYFFEGIEFHECEQKDISWVYFHKTTNRGQDHIMQVVMATPTMQGLTHHAGISEVSIITDRLMMCEIYSLTDIQYNCRDKHDSLSGKYPSCLQTTMASGWPNRSSHTVPQTPPTHISRRPSISETPPTRRSSPVVQLVVLSIQAQKTVTVTQSEDLRKTGQIDIYF